MLEHARAGEESATALLERLGRDGREVPVRLALRDLLERIARTVRPVARHAGVRLLVEAGDGFVVRARPGELAQVLLNLARNAIGSFVRRGTGTGEPLVRLVARGDGRRVLVEAIDNAGGVSPAQVPRLFRLGRSGRGSTGVGLYLARCLAERNGGTLAYRRVDGGSCFTLSLPRASVPRRDAGSRAARPAPVGSRRLRAARDTGLYCREMGLKILAINPGSTSTKLAIYDDTAEVWRVSLAHRSEDLARFARLGDQLEYRRSAVREALAGAPRDRRRPSSVGAGCSGRSPAGSTR